MIEAVAALSAVGIVHADIKPENVLLTYKVCIAAQHMLLTAHKCDTSHSHVLQSGGTRYRDLKLIDLGSAYMFKDPDTAAVRACGCVCERLATAADLPRPLPLSCWTANHARVPATGDGDSHRHCHVKGSNS